MDSHPEPPDTRTPPAPPKAPKRERSELALDKLIDFVLIFIGLYAAIAVQRWQDTAKEKDAYVALLGDFKRELNANLEQEGSIEKDLGLITDTTPGSNLGPMQATFTHFFEELSKDELLVKCLHEEFATGMQPGETHVKEECHPLYAQFEKAHSEPTESFNFSPVVLTPFYRYEVWELYLADGVTTFRNKELAVQIAEAYSNARLIEKQIADIEATFNDAFMKQVGRSAATDMELAEIVHDEEQAHGLSEQNQILLIHVAETIKDEHYASLEVLRILELKVERMKKIVLLMREEIEAVQKAIDEEIAKVER
ncbi:hypothetical protein [Enhygromyxa salina]|uniref:Uncharacterized protein n=1 Tax=Enhygromyxa salina TaxID=215803 RepID=A0A2S9Y4C2_9BACT|nr:hypothetical protein [Enhygromyxa salina]PRP99946.1 hypothetical protein ENSA7_61630 [Enhygromyxa salina]